MLFGGARASTLFDDTWTWDGRKWTLHAPAHRPSARTLAAMAFDEVAGLTVLFGGDNYQGENQVLSDTWTWDGTDWAAVQTAAAPERRFGASLAFDPTRHSLVLFGGHAANYKYFNDAWTWTKGNWAPVNVGPVRPSPRGEEAVVYDLKGGQLAVFGGALCATRMLGLALTDCPTARPGSSTTGLGRSAAWRGVPHRALRPLRPMTI